MCDNCEECEKEELTSFDIGKEDASYYIGFISELSEKLALDKEQVFNLLVKKVELDSKLRMVLELSGGKADEIGDIINSL